jgi:hypothetical protein
MPQELISRRLRNILRDYCSSFVLREIADEFDAADVPRGAEPDEPISGARRTLVQQYYNGLDFADPRDAGKFLNVLSVFMRNMEKNIESSPGPNAAGFPTYAANRFQEMKDQLRRDGYAFQQGTIVPITAAARLSDTKALAQRFDRQHIIEQIQRIEASIDGDPALAIGTAKELVESCFKTVLAGHSLEYSKNEDLPQLSKKACKAMKLLPDDIPDSAKGAETIRRILSNLSTIVQGVAELRGLYGTGHGKDGKAKGISPRHARLAVGAASTLVNFLFETDSEVRHVSQANGDAKQIN